MADAFSSVLEAIESNDVRTLHNLINSGHLDVNDVVDESSILGLAASSGNLEVVQLFLHNGANVNLPSDNPDVTTALMDAVYGKNIKIIKLLVGAGADVNEIRDGGNFALKIAAEIEDQEIYDYLAPLTSLELQQEAEEGLLTSLHKETIDESTRMFIEAVRRTEIKKIQQAIGSGIDVNAFDENGNTALMYAAQKGKFETVQILLKAGADPNISGEGVPPLIAAIGSGDSSIVRILVKAGANVNASIQGQTALTQATIYSNYFNSKVGQEIVQILVEAGAM